ncbi:MAG: serine/threonine-protein phosphatase [Ruminococcus sp.]|nr:serine/threonine-protein phosphatase [Ruminococcus sp.]
MNFLTAIHSDIGTRKNVNQDSCLTLEADTCLGRVLLCVVCDGMGGLAKGELASATVIKAFSAWFREELPDILREDFIKDAVFSSWERLLDRMNTLISSYGNSLGIRLGTTVCAALFVGNTYYIVNVGDSRAYNRSSTLSLLTHDQSFVQREIDEGRMTESEALVSDKRSVLLYCVGVNSYIRPDFYTGSFYEGELFFLCSDGFVHALSREELTAYLNPEQLFDEERLLATAYTLTETIKQRGEKDNISVILVKTG